MTPPLPNIPSMVERAWAWLSDHAGVCVTIVLAISAAGGGIIGGLMAHEARHAQIDTLVANALEDRRSIRDALVSLQDSQRRQLEILVTIKRNTQ